MKKFLALFATSSLAILGLTNCSGGGDTSSDADGNGIIDASEYKAGAGFELSGNSPGFRIAKGGIIEGETGGVVDRDVDLYIQDTSTSFRYVATVESNYGMISDTEALLTLTIPAQDLEDPRLAMLLGQEQGTSFLGGNVQITFHFGGTNAQTSATVIITSTPPDNGDDDNNNGNGGNGGNGGGGQQIGEPKEYAYVKFL